MCYKCSLVFVDNKSRRLHLLSKSSYGINHRLRHEGRPGASLPVEATRRCERDTILW
jgi:hypothetical protein